MTVEANHPAVNAGGVKMLLSDRWSETRTEDGSMWHIGRIHDPRGLIRAAAAGDEAALAVGLRAEPDSFACVVVAGDVSVAAVDMIRGFPLFHSVGAAGGERIGDDPRRMDAATEGDESLDTVALLEMVMGGWAANDRTMFSGIRQLQAGQFLWIRGGNTALRRYFEFTATRRSQPMQDLSKRLGEATDVTFSRIAGRVAGRPVWVPLSAGLDSRLVIAKLLEHGVSSVRAFSYGPPRNGEADRAREVAAHLGVEWHFIPCGRAEARAFFGSELRRELWRYADGGCAIPQMQDALAVHLGRERGLFTDDAVIINGQSGDFITGGHIPLQFMNGLADEAELAGALRDRHFSLWRHLARERSEPLGDIEASLYHLIDQEGPLTAAEACSAWEWWEWQERQAKYVVNGQRVYEFFGLDWELPLWSGEWLHFWRDVPLEDRLEQRLYRRYLEGYDFRGVFSAVGYDVWRWPGGSRFPVLAAGRLLGLFSSDAKDGFYRRMKYFGHYKDHYQIWPWQQFLRYAGAHRNQVSFYGLSWLRENAPAMVADLGFTD